jgi:hypothetical protein
MTEPAAGRGERNPEPAVDELLESDVDGVSRCVWCHELFVERRPDVLAVRRRGRRIAATCDQCETGWLQAKKGEL